MDYTVILPGMDAKRSFYEEVIGFCLERELSLPTDREFRHRTVFFRDPDGRFLEIYAEI